MLERYIECENSSILYSPKHYASDSVFLPGILKSKNQIQIKYLYNIKIFQRKFPFPFHWSWSWIMLTFLVNME